MSEENAQVQEEDVRWTSFLEEVRPKLSLGYVVSRYSEHGPNHDLVLRLLRDRNIELREIDPMDKAQSILELLTVVQESDILGLYLEEFDWNSDIEECILPLAQQTANSEIAERACRAVGTHAVDTENLVSCMNGQTEVVRRWAVGSLIAQHGQVVQEGVDGFKRNLLEVAMLRGLLGEPSEPVQLIREYLFASEFAELLPRNEFSLSLVSEDAIEALGSYRCALAEGLLPSDEELLGGAMEAKNESLAEELLRNLQMRWSGIKVEALPPRSADTLGDIIGKSPHASVKSTAFEMLITFGGATVDRLSRILELLGPITTDELLGLVRKRLQA
jgi:hypothetical protein